MKRSIIETRSQKLNAELTTLNLNKPNSSKLNPNDKWLHDIFLDEYFKAFSTDISRSRSDVLLLGPSTSQLLKSGNSYQVLECATCLSMESFNYLFFCVNDSIETHKVYSARESTNINGSHWSLLFINRLNQISYHFDSIKGLNRKHAKDLAHNVAPNYKFKEIETLQQSNSFECGVHVIVNAKYLLNKLKNQDSTFTREIDECINNKKTIQNDLRIIPSTITDENHKITLPSTNTLKSNDETKNVKIRVKEKGSNYKKVHRHKSHRTHKINKHRSINNHFEITCSNRFSSFNNDGSTKEKVPINENSEKSKSNPDIISNIKSDSELCIIPKKHTKDKLKCKVKLLSDSHGRYLRRNLEETLHDSFSVSSSFSPNGTSEQILKSLHDTKNMTMNDYLVLQCGTNDIENPFCDPEKITDHIRVFLESTKNTNIIICCIPFRYDKPNLNRKIYGINLKIRALALQYSNVQYLPLHGFYRSYYSSHGLHLNKKGNSELCNLLKSIILNTPSPSAIPVRVTTENRENNYKPKSHFLGLMLPPKCNF